MEKVCVMGLGNIGLPVASHVSKFYKTKGYDISEAAVTKALTKDVEASAQLEKADIYIIAVNTHYRNNSPDMSAVESCCSKISKINPNALVCFESTLSLGTARSLALKYNFKFVAVCPHRWWQHDQINHGVVQIRVLGSLNPESDSKAIEFYKKLGIPVHHVNSLELAEVSKLVENTDFYMRIAYAEELKGMCDKVGLNFNELREAVNTKWNVDLPEALSGIGGECLPKDIQFLLTKMPTAPLLHGAIETDEIYRKNLQAAKCTPQSAQFRSKTAEK
jgi:UDP-N-acetyl-D-mannosaminuronic acid dehydrogenase